jgi:hypothetical protein
MPSYKATFISRVNTAKLFASGEQKLLRSRLTASSEFSPKFRHQLRALLVLKSNAPKSSRATVEGAYLLLYFFLFSSQIERGKHLAATRDYAPPASSLSLSCSLYLPQ